MVYLYIQVTQGFLPKVEYTPGSLPVSIKIQNLCVHTCKLGTL